MTNTIDRLASMFARQEEMARNFIPLDELRDGSQPLEQGRWLHLYLMCVAEEVFEAAREIPARKFWSKKRDTPIQRPKLLEEMVDVLHFYIAALLIAGFTPDELYSVYNAKFDVNKERVKSGY